MDTPATPVESDTAPRRGPQRGTGVKAADPALVETAETPVPTEAPPVHEDPEEVAERGLSGPYIADMRRYGLHWTGAPETTLHPPGGGLIVPGRDLTGDEARARILTRKTLLWVLARGFTLVDPPADPTETKEATA